MLTFYSISGFYRYSLETLNKTRSNLTIFGEEEGGRRGELAGRLITAVAAVTGGAASFSSSSLLLALGGTLFD